MRKKNYFTSESVSEGHPDKVCDLISDSVLDACLEQDRKSRVACECFATTNLVVVGGEISTKAKVDVEQVVRDTVKKIGYEYDDIDFNANTLEVKNAIDLQSPDISMGVDKAGSMGAGDQGIMFGFATDETENLMPYPIHLAHSLLQFASDLRKSGALPFLRPDAKSQITVEYVDGKAKRVDAVVLSHQHDTSISAEDVREEILKSIISPFFKNTNLFDHETKLFINNTGRFVIGGPHADTGLTGRKIIVDTYGGYSRHGGGAFSGKDASKVDRSAAYMARHVAKSIVHHGLAKKLEVQFSYAIGHDSPVSVFVETFGTGKYDDEIIVKIIKKTFDLTPAGIIQYLRLDEPIFQKTTNYGHFGKDGLTWENPVEELKWN